jgi:hypothetical protein
MRPDEIPVWRCSAGCQYHTSSRSFLGSTMEDTMETYATAVSFTHTHTNSKACPFNLQICERRDLCCFKSSSTALGNKYTQKAGTWSKTETVTVLNKHSRRHPRDLQEVILAEVTQPWAVTLPVWICMSPALCGPIICVKSKTETSQSCNLAGGKEEASQPQWSSLCPATWFSTVVDT